MDIWAGRIANQQPGSQVDHLCSIFHHFLSRVFDIAAWASVASGVAHQLNLRIGILGKCAFLVPYRPQAFSPRAGAIAVANNDPDLYFVNHFSLLYKVKHESSLMIFQAGW
jgi:hypothetical protein